MSGLTTSVNGSEPDYEKKGAQTPPEPQVLAVPTPAPKHSKYSIKAFWHWLGDRDIHVWIMSLGFTLLFTSYPIQGVQTIRFPDTGAYILIVLYSAYFVTSMWATFFLSWWGLEFCLIWGPISYGTWIACMFANNNAANLVGAAFFGWGAGILWPAAGQLIAACSTPHNRASNAGIYQCAFHLGVFAGGLILGGVQKGLPNWNHQYAVFLGLCGSSVICFFIHAISFRRRFRGHKSSTDAAHVEAQPEELHRVKLDDGTVEYRKVERADLKNENAVVQDLALTGGSGGGGGAAGKLAAWKANFWNPVKMLWHPVFGPLGPSIFVTGGMTQGWFNASFNKIVNKVGGDWNGWIYAISESWALVAAIVFGIFYDRLRTRYVASKFRWIMYIYIGAYYCLCGLALAAYYLGERGVGSGPGMTKPSHYKVVLSFAGAFYNIQLLALEVSILTYLSTFLTYNADVAFSSKIGCEAGGYLLVFGLVNVLNPKWMIVTLFCAGPPAHLVYLIWWHAPDRPVAEILESANSSQTAISSPVAESVDEKHGASPADSPSHAAHDVVPVVAK